MMAHGMKVTMVVHSDYFHDHRVRREASALISAGYSLSVIALSPGFERSCVDAADDAKIHCIKLDKKSGKARYFEMIRKTRKTLHALPAPDVFHAHDLDALIAVAAFAKAREIPLIYDSHELHTEVHSLQNRPFTKAIWKFLEKKYIRNADRIITVSDGIAELLQQRYILESTPSVVRNFTNPPEESSTNPNGDALTEAITLPNTEYISLYQGMLQPGRGVELMIEAVAALPEWSLVICGDGMLRQQLEDLTRQHGCVDRVLFTGMISRSQINTITKSCTLGFLLTEPLGLSHYYSLPNKLTEYIQAGLPILATGLPEIRRIVNNYSVGITIPPEELSAESVAERMKEFGDNPGAFGKGLKKAAGELNWDAEKQRLLDVYAELKA